LVSDGLRKASTAPRDSHSALAFSIGQLGLVLSTVLSLLSLANVHLQNGKDEGTLDMSLHNVPTAVGLELDLILVSEAGLDDPRNCNLWQRRYAPASYVIFNSILIQFNSPFYPIG